MQLFSVFDSKAEAYLPIFQSQTNGTAIRSFEAAVNEEGTPFYKNAADYTLFNIGEFDERTGNVKPSKAHNNLGTALQYLNTEQELPLTPVHGVL